MEFLRNLWVEEEGQGLAEYGLILALIAVVVIGALTALSGGLDTILRFVGGKLNDAAPSNP